MPIRADTPRPAATTATTATSSASTAAAALDKKATAWVRAFAGRGSKSHFPPIDSGNRGLSAFVPTPAQSTAILKAAQKLQPGAVDMQKAKFDPTKQRMVVVLTSDDEPAVHLSLQDKKTGALVYVGDVNSIDLGSDFPAELTKLARGAAWLQLGKGSAAPNWWQS